MCCFGVALCLASGVSRACRTAHLPNRPYLSSVQEGYQRQSKLSRALHELRIDTWDSVSSSYLYHILFHSAPYADVCCCDRSRDWHEGALAAAKAEGLREKLGRVCPSYECQGKVSPFFSTKFGLNPK